MAESANVKSLESIEGLLHTTQALRHDLLKQLDHLQKELSRLEHWLNNNVVDYWSTQFRIAKRLESECQQNLTRCMSHVRSNERRPCTEEKKRLQKAEERVRLCESKLKFIQRVQHEWETTMTKLRTRYKHNLDLAENDLRLSIEELHSHINLLRRYAGLSPQSNPSEAPGDSPT